MKKNYVNLPFKGIFYSFPPKFTLNFDRDRYSQPLVKNVFVAAVMTYLAVISTLLHKQPPFLAATLQLLTALLAPFTKF